MPNETLQPESAAAEMSASLDQFKKCFKHWDSLTPAQKKEASKAFTQIFLKNLPADFVEEAKKYLQERQRNHT